MFGQFQPASKFRMVTSLLLIDMPIDDQEDFVSTILAYWYVLSTHCERLLEDNMLVDFMMHLVGEFCLQELK